MRVRHIALLAAAASVGAFVACTLNPQPLPPRDDFGGESSLADAGARSEGGAFGTTPENPSADAATGTPNLDSEGGAGEGGDDAGDGGDGGATDASDDGG